MIETPPFSKCFLILTEDCNLRCKYCYENTNRCNNNYMSFDTAKKSADFLFDNALKHGIKSLKWTFFGGEPLLNLDVLIKFFRYAIEKANQLKIDLVFSLVTNGTIYNNKYEEFILEWHKISKSISIQISTDGIPEVQDKNRTTVSGMPTSQIVLENISKLKKLFGHNQIKTSSLNTHSVITKDTISKVFLSYEYFKKLGINDISFALSDEKDWNENDISVYIEQLSLIADFIYDECVMSGSLSPYQNAHIFIGLKSAISKNTCEAGKTFCAITPNGDIYPCDRTCFSNHDFRIGNVFDGIADNSNRKMFFETFRSDMHADNINCGKCDNTECKICMTQNYEQFNDVLKCNPSVCSIYKAKWDFIIKTKKKFDKLSNKLNYNKCDEMTFFKALN